MTSSFSFLLLFMTILVSCCVDCFFIPSSFHASSLYNHNVHEKFLSSSILGSRSGYSDTSRSSGESVSYKLIKTQSEVNEADQCLQCCSEVSLDLEFDRDRFAYGTNNNQSTSTDFFSLHTSQFVEIMLKYIKFLNMYNRTYTCSQCRYNIKFGAGERAV